MQPIALYLRYGYGYGLSPVRGVSAYDTDPREDTDPITPDRVIVLVPGAACNIGRTGDINVVVGPNTGEWLSGLWDQDGQSHRPEIADIRPFRPGEPYMTGAALFAALDGGDNDARDHEPR